MFHVLRSSAGAGKTHSLVKHYLTLCLGSEDPAAYRTVLALTFTNKAAHEMKERAVRYLRDLAAKNEPDGAMRDVLDHLQRTAGLADQQLADRADRMLRHMLHHWNDVAISTIDAFTQRVVRPFARDLRLHQDLRMTTDQDGYLQQAVERLIALAGEDPRVTEILGQACLQLLHEEQRWDPERPLVQLSRELLNERSIAPLQRIASMDSGDVARISSVLRTEEKRFRERMQGYGREALALLDNAGITARDLHYGQKGIHSMFQKLADFRNELVTPNRYADATLTEQRWASENITPQGRAALEAIIPDLERLARTAVAEQGSGFRDFLLRGAVLRELPATFALHELERQLEALKQEDGVAFFSDLTRRVAEIVAREPVPFIHERMGERYQHFLIDEFQDTSLLQWTCLLPLIDNALSSGGSALLVGDAKQAIYRWRNGEVRLFTELPHLFGRSEDPLAVEREATLLRTFRPLDRLVHNRRSSPTIIAFNNALFGALAEALPPTLRSVYDAHDQLPGGERPGMVEVRVLNAEMNGDERWDELLAHVEEALRNALEDGARPGDVAILVRTGNQGARVAQHLLSKGFAVLSPDGLKVAADIRVGMVIDALRALFFHDATAAVRVLQARAVSRQEGTSIVDPLAGRTSVPDAMNELRAITMPLPLASSHDLLPELLLHLHDTLLPLQDVHGPFLALLDEAHGWSSEQGADVPGFLQYWDRTGASRSTAPPDDGGAVHIMTIHKAKGLEFPVVIVPDANMRPRGRSNDRIWVGTGEAVPGLDTALVAYVTALRNAGVPELQVEEELRLLDDLNLLYVAFTRPVDRLHVFVHGNASGTIVREFREHIATLCEGAHYLSGDRCTLQGRRSASTEDHLARPPAAALRYPLELRTTRGQLGGHAVERGRKLHAVMARITEVAQLADALRDAQEAGEITAADREALLPELRAKLSDPRLSPWYGGTSNVRNEATIIDADGKAWRPDRVVLDAAGVRVLDLKTGAPRPEHNDQVGRYLSLLQRMGHTHVEGALYYITQDQLVDVRPWN
jgi:ATP-dependent exoDNAse (exonuclease V) beta subunit